MQIVRYVVILTLLVYVVCGSFITVPKKIKKLSPQIITIIICFISLSIYMNEVVINILLITSGIVYLYSLENNIVESNSMKKTHVKKKQRNEESLENGNKDKDKSKECVYQLDSEHVNSTKHKDFKTQSNIFNKLNYDLYYNELGEQLNIQGIDVEVNGYDRSIYTTL